LIYSAGGSGSGIAPLPEDYLRVCILPILDRKSVVCKSVGAEIEVIVCHLKDLKERRSVAAYSAFQRAQYLSGFACMERMRKIRIGIADDHPLTLRGLEHYLLSLADIEICFKSESIGHLLVQLVDTPVDVLLCDYEFEDDSYADGLILLDRIRRMAPLTRVIFLSSHSSVYIVSAALGAGAAGFISKRGPDFLNLAGAIRVVKSEGIYLSESLASKMLATTGRPKETGSHPGVLSERESTVVRMICDGMSIREVARRLRRSPKTVSNQKNAGMKKLGAKNDVELALIMREWNVN